MTLAAAWAGAEAASTQVSLLLLLVVVLVSRAQLALGVLLQRGTSWLQGLLLPAVEWWQQQQLYCLLAAVAAWHAYPCVCLRLLWLLPLWAYAHQGRLLLLALQLMLLLLLLLPHHPHPAAAAAAWPLCPRLLQQTQQQCV